MNKKYVLWLNEVDMKDVSTVGGKNASLGEMIQNLKSKGINVPNGYVVTTHGYHAFLKYNNLLSQINNLLDTIISSNNLIKQRQIGSRVRTLIQNGKLPTNLKKQITDTYIQLSNQYTYESNEKHQFVDVAVRSSSTAEDLKDASFAGQQDTYLNIRGEIKLCEAIKNCFASLYTDRAISYRKKIKYHETISISVCIQKMVRSDLASSGVAFTIDPDTGFKDVIFINGSWGLGELIVSGEITPDEFLLRKTNLKNNNYGAIIGKKMGDKDKKLAYGYNKQTTALVSVNKQKKNEFCMYDDQLIQLGRWALIIEKYYTQLNKRWNPVDIEWAIDGLDNQLYIVQARPETVQSNKHTTEIIEYHINKQSQDKVLVTGTAVGDSIGTGTVKVLYSLDERDGNPGASDFKQGDILVTDMTTPDWEPIMKIAGGIITNKGGRVCHASIIAREFGVPAIVGTRNATKLLTTGQDVSVCCAEGDVGIVYSGKIKFTTTKTPISGLPKIKTKLMLNIADPNKAFKDAVLPHKGVGLLRLEFIINNFIEVHPNALLKHKDLGDKILSEKINKLIHGYADEKDYYIKKLSYGIGKIATAFYPYPVIVRFSDFKSNEYRNLLGGKYFEPDEENPMIGWRGCSRYYDDKFKQAFLLECQAIKYVREIMNLENVIVMLPFCRTVGECIRVQKVMEEGGLKRGTNGLQVYLMCEIPANVILAKQFCQHIDGFSIGSNDLTQLTLGLDRDSELVSHLFDENNEAVKEMIRMVIKTAHKYKKKIGICGQAPADKPEFAQFLVSLGIDSISITSDSILKTLKAISQIENELDN
uniref:pyruvate, water dikinase n=1 Tax=Mimivirus LCMiAC02 TaxID=2506609 RepID=A0A481Z222_9VIRU|nr:MAG: pyruvate phosphate dikinase [Mimivirus LCMiAC02]